MSYVPAANCFDELLRSNDPRNPPSWQAEPLGEPVNKEDVVFINVFNIFSRAHGSTY